MKRYSGRKKERPVSEPGFAPLENCRGAEKSFLGKIKGEFFCKTNWGLRSVRKKNSLTGFTLLEVLISAAIVSVLSVVMYAVFSTGVKTWKKAQEMRFLEKNVFGSLQELTVDLRNCPKIATLPVKGSSDSISFPGLVKKNDEKQPGLIKYYFDGEKDSIIKSTETYAEALSEEESGEKGAGKAIIGNISRFSLEYCCLDTDTGLYGWREDWGAEDDAAGIPRAVKIFIELDKDGRKISVEKFVLIPVGLSEHRGPSK